MVFSYRCSEAGDHKSF